MGKIVEWPIIPIAMPKKMKEKSCDEHADHFLEEYASDLILDTKDPAIQNGIKINKKTKKEIDTDLIMMHFNRHYVATMDIDGAVELLEKMSEAVKERMRDDTPTAS